MPVQVDLSRDKNFDALGLATLRDQHLSPGESPQEALARVSTAFSDDVAHAQRLYDYASKHWFMFSTPILSNAGTDRGLPISCFLNCVDDSRESILNHYAEVGWLSSTGGGVGSYWGQLRSSNEKTSKGSASSGVIPFVKVVDSLIMSFSQGVTRRGAAAVYLDVGHPEILEWLSMRRKSGGDLNRKTLNLNNGVCLPDTFMVAVKEGKDWDLVDPHSGAIKGTISARSLWRQILTTRVETGEPYLFFTDTANRALPQPLKDLGLKIHASNLCVAPETNILTTSGYVKIRDVIDQKVDVWNGEQWSSVEVVKTGMGQPLITVVLSDGSAITCTAYHKFFVKPNYKEDACERRARDLVIGDKLEKFELPVIAGSDEWTYPYANGFHSGDGTHGQAGRPIFWLYGEKKLLAPCLMTEGARYHDHDSQRYAIYHRNGILRPKFSVPLTGTIETKLLWLAGYVDADGCLGLVSDNESLQISSVNLEFLREVHLLLNTLGCQPKIRPLAEAGERMMPDHRGGLASSECRASYRLLITSNDLYRLAKLGFAPKRIHVSGTKPQRDARQFVYVEEVKDTGRIDDTYCFNEPLRHRGVFEGILTGNCTEIMLPTSPERTAVCCLSSVNLALWLDWCEDERFIEDLMRMLDNALTSYIENAPPGHARAVLSASRERSVGLGAMGFHSLLQNANLPFGSDLARGYNLMVFEHLRKKADEASLVLGKERGEAPDMAGTGERFSHKLAIAPNATSALVCGNVSPSIEPRRANGYLQKTMGGTFIVKNSVLEKTLDLLGQNTESVWKSIATNDGSVQHLDFLTPWMKQVFLTAIEINQDDIIQLAADRQQFIDQGQSVNLFVVPDIQARDLHRLHFSAWEKGLKALYYCRSHALKRAAISTLDHERVEIMTVPVDETSCVACEG